jgi:hypothetical protein
VNGLNARLLLRIGERLLTIVTRIWRSLFAYQIIIVARRGTLS